MYRKNLIVTLCVAAGVALAGSITIAQQAKEPEKGGCKHGQGAAGHEEMKLPPGWTPADMQSCMIAATPGKMHERLASGVGVWQGKSTMWMGVGTEPIPSTCTATVTAIMDGRYTKCEVSGPMPGMGMFNGLGIYGYDNVAQKFVSTWVDSCGTGIANGNGELSPDGKTMTWRSTFNCPIRKGPATIREVDTTTGPDAKTFEIFATDPKTGQEYKMLHVDYVRGAAPAAGTASAGV